MPTPSSLTRTLILVLLIGCSSLFCRAQAQASFDLDTASPKLKQFLANHPVASKALSNALSESFGSRKLHLYYFYTHDESVPSADHLFPDNSTVWIRVRENLPASDEFICFLFEVFNSQGDQRFQELAEMAKEGTISKTDFVTELMKQEFVAVKRMRDLMPSLGFNPHEKVESHYYKLLIQSPDDFNEYLSYLHKSSPKRDQAKEYEDYYDLVSKKNETPPVGPNAK